MADDAQQARLDCLVIGGGPAGLVAAVYLARYRRHAVLVDDGGSRLTMSPKSRNVMGFPDGIAGPELLERMRLQAARFGAALELGRVENLARLDDGGFEAFAGSRRFLARTVLLATGARDVAPDVPGLGPAMKAGQVRYCPVCDGYETKGQRVAVLGRDEHGLREAVFVSCFGNHVTWLTMGSEHAVPEHELAQARRLGVVIADSPVRGIDCALGHGVRVDLDGGQRLTFDVLYRRSASPMLRSWPPPSARALATTASSKSTITCRPRSMGCTRRATSRAA